MHSGIPIFFRVRIERMAVNMGAVQRQHGLEQMLGGHATLANVMGPNEDLAVKLGDPVNAIVCMDCSIRGSVAEIEELGADKT